MKKNLTHFYCKCVTTGSMKMGRTWLDLSLTYDSCAQWAVTSNEGKVECFRVSLLLSKVSNEKQNKKYSDVKILCIATRKIQ